MFYIELVPVSLQNKNIQERTTTKKEKKSPSTQKYVLFIVASLGCLTFTVQKVKSEFKMCNGSVFKGEYLLL